VTTQTCWGCKRILYCTCYPSVHFDGSCGRNIWDAQWMVNQYTYSTCAGSRDSVVSIATRYGLEGPGIESRWGEIFRIYPDRLRGPPSLLHNGYRVFPGSKGGRGVMLTTHPLLVPRLRKSWAIPPLTPCVLQGRATFILHVLWPAHFIPWPALFLYKYLQLLLSIFSRYVETYLPTAPPDGACGRRETEIKKNC
jgi:hypothetical protein